MATKEKKATTIHSLEPLKLLFSIANHTLPFPGYIHPSENGLIDSDLGSIQRPFRFFIFFHYTVFKPISARIPFTKSFSQKTFGFVIHR